jgi:hypothetical protein
MVLPTTDERKEYRHARHPHHPAACLLALERLGVNPREIEKLRSRGELFAVRYRDEWLYPAWQFGPGGSIPTGVREAVKAARAAGLDETRLVALLRRPAGLLGATRLLDLLFEGRSDFVVEAVRSAAAA